MKEPEFQNWSFLKTLPCSCRDGKQDQEYGPYLRVHEQAWHDWEVREVRTYDWKCRACGHVKGVLEIVKDRDA